MPNPTPPDHDATTFVAWVFPTALAVDAAELRIKRFEQQGRLTVKDSATVIWQPGEKAPQVARRHSTAQAAGKGALWGGVLGTLLGGPLAGAAVGAAAAGAGRRMRRPHLPPAVVAAVRDELRPGGSALLVLADGPAADLIEAVTGNERDVKVLTAAVDDGGQDDGPSS